MAETGIATGEAEEFAEESAVESPRRSGAWRWTFRVIFGLVALALFIVMAAVAFLHTKPGRQFIVDEIAKVAPASGLKVEVGRIEGSVLWSSTLYDVKFRDANDTLFLEVPEIELNWRPYRWFTSGLDVRHLVLHDGILRAFPELEPGDPDAPILPEFDIRVDRFVIDNLTVAEGLLGDQRSIDFQAKADIREGKVLLDADGEFGGGDVFALMVDAEPDGNDFDLDVEWRAPAGGFLASMVGAQDSLAVDIDGTGTWSAWKGDVIALQGGENLLDLDLYNESGQYRLVGSIYPGDLLTGLPADALGEMVQLTASGTLEDSVLDGNFLLGGKGVDVEGAGAIDLANNRVDGMQFVANLLDPALFGDAAMLNDARLSGTLDGSFRDLALVHELRVGELDASGTILSGLVQKGTLTWDGTRATIPLNAQVARITSGNELVDPRLVNGTLAGTLVYQGNSLLSDNLRVRFPGLDARLSLRGDLQAGSYQLAGPVDVRGLEFDNVGQVDTAARIRFALGAAGVWTLDADLQGRVSPVSNDTLANLAGEPILFGGALRLGTDQPIVFNRFTVDADKLQARLDGRVDERGTSLVGNGRHVDYGPFTVEALIADDGPRAVLVFADPLPAAGLTDVRVALAPTDNGFRIETQGGSMLGPFDGLLGLVIADNGDVRIGVDRLDVAQTRITGDLALLDGGVAGTLDLSRGGVNGTIALAPRADGQGFDADITAANAVFQGPTMLSINRGSLQARGTIGSATDIAGEFSAQGVRYGSLFIGRAAGKAQVRDGVGSFDAALAGARGSRFSLLLNGQVQPDRITLAGEGRYAERKITMPRRAVLLKTADGGWQLQKTQLSYGDEGFLIAEGRFGGSEAMQGKLSLSGLPLSLVDITGADLGLGGTISGVVQLGQGRSGLPTADARVMVRNLTRSSLSITSQPVDLALVLNLSENALQTRAVMQTDTGTTGRVQALISNLPAGGSVSERLYRGALQAQLRYSGPAASLWRLAAIDLFDVTGDLQVAANATGTLGDPRVVGSMAGDALRIRSLLTGSDVQNVRARGRFDGSRLQITSLAGTAPNGGTVSGSGTVDLSGMTADRGPQIDLRIAARNAEILDLKTMGATVTGPMRIVSNGVGGTIAGRLEVRKARWRLGRAEEAIALPNIKTTEINLPADRAPARAAAAPWRFLIDAKAASGIDVEGMGLESEWSADVKLRGTTEAPLIDGEARVIPRQGFYSFAGTRFELTRGVIDFDGRSPPDPRVDILAETNVDGLSVAVNVRGNSSLPEITFSSVPALPEEELLARLLFGGSITSLSATDALQLGSALASLRGGSGLGPINKLRNAIGLDRLRIIPADPALDRGTSVALGKNVTRRFYVEIVTDGAGYSATEVEFRVTSWLNLLGTVSTIGRNSVAAEYSRDY